MEITLYELLGLIKDDKAPKKIRYFGRDYEYSINDEGIDYIEIDKEAGKHYLTDIIGENYLSSIFSTTVETIERVKEIEEISNEHNFYSYSEYNERKNEIDKILYIISAINSVNNRLSDTNIKINELIRRVNKLKND